MCGGGGCKVKTFFFCFFLKGRFLRKHNDVASDVGVNFKNVGVLSIESSLFHLFLYIFTN